MVHRCGYVLHTTGTDASAQNELAEKPNQDLGVSCVVCYIVQALVVSSDCMHYNTQRT